MCVRKVVTLAMIAKMVWHLIAFVMASCMSDVHAQGGDARNDDARDATRDRGSS